MSEDLIRREDAIKAMEQRYEDILRIFKRKVKVGEKAIALDMIGCVKSLPSADRPQGKWKPFDLTWGRSIYACSVCEEAIAVPCGWSDGKPIYDYCPMCGAQMKGADDE